MNLKLTNAEWMNLFHALSTMNVNGNAKFTYVIAKNRATIKPHVEALNDAAQSYGKTNPRVAEYQKRMDEMLKAYAVDEKGKPTTRQSPDGQTLQRVIPAAKMAEFVTAREVLDKEFSDVILGMDAANADFAKLLKDEQELEGIRTMSLKDLPEGGINTQLMNLIFVFVEDDKAEVTPLKAVEPR